MDSLIAFLHHHLRALLADPDTEFLLAGDAGFCQLRYRLSVWTGVEDCWLEDLFVEEEARGTGLQKAIGELITCPYCLAPWVATAMSVAWIAAPRKTRWLAGVITIAAISDVCQQLYAALRKLST